LWTLLSRNDPATDKTGGSHASLSRSDNASSSLYEDRNQRPCQITDRPDGTLDETHDQIRERTQGWTRAKPLNTLGNIARRHGVTGPGITRIIANLDADKIQQVKFDLVQAIAVAI